MQDWWEELFEQMLEVSVWNLMRIEEHNDGSMEAHEVMKDRKRQTAEAKDTDAVVGD